MEKVSREAANKAAFRVWFMEVCRIIADGMETGLDPWRDINRMMSYAVEDENMSPEAFYRLYFFAWDACQAL